MELYFIVVISLFSFNEVISEECCLYESTKNSEYWTKNNDILKKVDASEFDKEQRDFYAATYVNDLDILSAYATSFDFIGINEFDIVVLSPKETPIPYNDKMLNFLSVSAKKGRMHIAAYLLEQVSCDNSPSSIRHNLVFDKNGDLIASTRRLSNEAFNCDIKELNITENYTEPTIFTTDFGVTFALLMEEDLVLQKPEKFRGVKNYIVPEIRGLDLPFYDTLQFASSWAFSNQASLLTGSSIFAGEKRIGMAALSKNGGTEYKPFHPMKSERNSFEEHLTATSMKYKNMYETSETVCQEEFCCQFYLNGSSQGLAENYKIFVFNGLSSIGRYDIGVQNCIITPKIIGSDSDVTFDTITIVANFTKGNAQYPIISSRDESNSIIFDRRSTTDTDTVTITISNAKRINGFGIFGRDYSKDSIRVHSVINEVVEFFDYLWIRLRVLIFVASIYVLEMM